MSVAPRPATPRVLVLCDDPMETQLLRSLLRALPDPRPDIFVHDALDDLLPPDVADFDCCFLGFGYAGVPTARIARLLRTAAPALRVIGTLSAQQRHGDRMELVEALRAGVSDFVDVAELSVSTLNTLLRPQPAEAPRLPPREARELPRPAPGRGKTAVRQPVEPETPERSISGAWHIVLGEQRAGFDAETCRRLGYAPAELGEGIGDWKSLIHPDDVDRLVQELHRVLDGSAPPHPVNYRIKSRDAGWLQVVSDDISVELDETGAPRSITGHFYGGEPSTRAPAGIPPPAQPEPASGAAAPGSDILANCATGVIVYGHDPESGTFRIRYCNPAAAEIEGRDLSSLVGARARTVSPQFDAFDLEDALERVADTGIPETHELMVIARGGDPRWRRYRITRLPDDAVLCEMEDVSEQVNARLSKRDQDELAQHVTRSYPVTTLLLDEHGRIVDCVSAADAFGARGKDTIRELLGEQAGQECVQQLNRTLNTGRPGTATYCVETEGGRQWLECHSAPLRGRPGTPQRVVLTLLDVSTRLREIEKLEAAVQHLRGALRQVPMPLYLKDLDGRYLLVNPAFEALFGVEESMLAGKTDFEIFPDELAAELHEDDLRIIERRETFSGMRTLGQGESRERYLCWCFPVGGGDRILGTGGIWVAPAALRASGAAAANTPSHDLGAHRDASGDELAGATASVIGRVENALAEAGDYADVLRQLEQLVETTMQAQALIHQVAGQADPLHPRALVALAPLAQDIVELERILVPPSARLENDIESTLPPAQCDPVVFHQILLRGIRHARRSLGPAGSIGIRLRRTTPGRRPCLSCKEGFEGSYVELVIEDSDSNLSDEDIRNLTAAPEAAREGKSALEDLVAIHTLAHGQGGHLQIQKNLPTGTSVHIFFKAGDPAEIGELPEQSRSTVASFPLGRIWGKKNPP